MIEQTSNPVRNASFAAGGNPDEVLGNSKVVLRHEKKLKQDSKFTESKIKYFTDDGVPQTDKITDIGNLQIERQNPKEKNIQVIPLVDDNKSRSERITDFEKLSQGSRIDFNSSIDIGPILNSGDKVICSLDAEEVEDYPSSTIANSVRGECKISLVETASGYTKLHFSLAEGSYMIKATESFGLFKKGIYESCCFCLTSFVDTSSSEARMEYDKTSKFTAQDCILPIKNSFLDAFVYRQGANFFKASFDSSIKKDAQKDNFCLDCCINPAKAWAACIKYYLDCFGSCTKLCFIASTGQYMCRPELRWIYLLCCCPGCAYWLCSYQCLIDYCLCYRLSGVDMKAGLSFQAEAEFKFGGGYKDDKLPYVAEDKFKEPITKLCPFYMGGCCTFLDPLAYEPDYMKVFKVCYCLSGKNPVATNTQHEGDSNNWQIEKAFNNRIIVVIHYKHFLDKKNHKCKIYLKVKNPAEVDRIYTNARRFISELSEKKYLLKYDDIDFQSIVYNSEDERRTDEDIKKKAMNLQKGIEEPESKRSSSTLLGSVLGNVGIF